jgi:ubiquinone/menaquinone biosynthesis C-methylase UbiE
MTEETFRNWVQSEEWYQTIELSGGITTRGSVDSRQRMRFLERIDPRDMRVLDIGCNSGAYSLWAKRNGAREVIGIDIQDKRLEQARKLAAHERLDITFTNRDLLTLHELGTFDLVMCFAVVTEIQDLFGALGAIARVIGKQALLELNLAKPVAYVSRSKNFIRGYPGISRRTAVCEPRHTKHGWMIDPSLDVLAAVFGSQFRVRELGESVRYDMVEITRLG